ncbi:MAG: hypothetical protein WBE92_09385 [Steroidobacteraceae bacterium]
MGGPALLHRGAAEGGPRQLFEWATEKLAVRLNIDRADLPGLNERAGLSRCGQLL